MAKEGSTDLRRTLAQREAGRGPEAGAFGSICFSCGGILIDGAKHSSVRGDGVT